MKMSLTGAVLTAVGGREGAGGPGYGGSAIGGAVHPVRPARTRNANDDEREDQAADDVPGATPEHLFVTKHDRPPLGVALGALKRAYRTVSRLLPSGVCARCR